MKKYILISFLIFILISCHQKKVKHYFDTGELKYEKYFASNDSSTFYVKEYYKNGILKQEGNIKKYNLPDGHWKEYYSDGVLKYECDYIDGKGKLQNLNVNGSWPNLDYISNDLPMALSVHAIYCLVRI